MMRLISTDPNIDLKQETLTKRESANLRWRQSSVKSQSDWLKCIQVVYGSPHQFSCHCIFTNPAIFSQRVLLQMLDRWLVLTSICIPSFSNHNFQLCRDHRFVFRCKWTILLGIFLIVSFKIDCKNYVL